ncbi:MAG: hypothetical protein JNK60_07490, partial [Acidobacteria bacterium]|nr:hypothetical protein [Acidobacteriota bacterium]
MPRPPVRVASSVEPVSEGGVRRHGTSWIRRDGPGQGILVGRFSGTPYEMGRSFGRLTRTRMDAQEQHLLRLFRALIPSPLLREGILTLTKLRLRGLAREIPPELDLAIAGLAEGYGPGVEDAYARILWLHALHEESQRFVDAPGLSALCTGFLAPPHGRSTETLLARNFDFEGGEILDREKLVAVFAPE